MRLPPHEAAHPSTLTVVGGELVDLTHFNDHAWDAELHSPVDTYPQDETRLEERILRLHPPTQPATRVHCDDGDGSDESELEII